MSLPHFEYDRPDLAGDPKDDDARTLDSLVESHAQPPDADQLPLVRVEPLITPKKITRLMTGSLNLLSTFNAPQQILPADADRTMLKINVNSATAADLVYVTDEQNKALNYVNSLVISPATRSFNLDGHTGPVWVYIAPGFVGPALVTWAAVTL